MTKPTTRKQKKQKLNNKIIYNNYNASSQKSFDTIGDSAENPIIGSIREYVRKQDNPKEVFHHARSEKDYGQNIKNKINSFFLHSHEKHNDIEDYRNIIIKNDNKIKHKIIRRFAGMHDIKCAFICCFLEMSIVFMLATFINAKGKFDFSVLWNDIDSQFSERPKESWLIFALAILLFIIASVIIPKLVKHYVCTPYLNSRAAVFEIAWGNVRNIDERYIHKICQRYVGMLNGSTPIDGTDIDANPDFVRVITSINNKDSTNAFEKVKLIDRFLWEGYYVDCDKSIVANPYFVKNNIEIKHNPKLRLENTSELEGESRESQSTTC